MDKKAGDIFESLIRNNSEQSVRYKLSQKKLRSLTDHLTPQELLKFEQWLNDKGSQDFLNESMKAGPRMNFGVVTRVVNLPNGNANVTYCNDSGRVMAFGYSKEVYSEAPDGYHEGDILVIRYTEPGWTPDSVTPIICDQEDYLSIVRRIAGSRK